MKKKLLCLRCPLLGLSRYLQCIRDFPGFGHATKRPAVSLSSPTTQMEHYIGKGKKAGRMEGGGWA